MDTISVDDFDADELRSASYYHRATAGYDHSREAA